MRHHALFVVVLFILFGQVQSNCAFGQTYGTASNTLTIIVQPITVLQVSGGIVNLTISGTNAIAGQDQMTTMDQTSSLAWGTNSSLKKITASTSLAAPLYTLRLAAANPTSGTAASQFTLSTTASDLVLNIGRTSGSCTLSYTAIALASQGTGTDAHTITFTIQAQ